MHGKELLIFGFCLVFSFLSGCDRGKGTKSDGKGFEWGLQVSKNGRYLKTENEEPFFWLGDTGWLLFSKLNLQESKFYIDKRAAQGFNVIQTMLLHNLSTTNVNGDSALVHQDISKPNIEANKGGYWEQVDFVINMAAQKGIYMAMVPIWGSNVKTGKISRKQAKEYALFLADRYGDKPNIIWLNGGDIKGDNYEEIWEVIGRTISKQDSFHLMTFHPRGRSSSAEWFHNEKWLDFNMFQSGHQTYSQDSLGFGEDNWKYVRDALNKLPAKPVLDGEPSYEGIPKGLHDITQSRWTAAEIRRSAYWSVFAGSFGHTYGSNSVMQMYSIADTISAYGASKYWFDAVDAVGAKQMIYLKELMLSRPYFNRVPDSTLIVNQRKGIERLTATRGKDYVFIYSYTGREIIVDLDKMKSEMIGVTWFDPRDGSFTSMDTLKNKGRRGFDPPGEEYKGNDWILILDNLK